MLLRSKLAILLALALAGCGATWVLPGKGQHSAAGGGAAFSEDFNRADNDSLGANWTEISGDSDIQSNTFLIQSDSASRGSFYTGTALSVSHYVKGKIGAVYSGKYYQLYLRVTDASSPFYAIEFGATNDTDIAWTSFNTAFTSGHAEGAATLVFAANDIIGVTIEGTGNGTTVRIWQNPTGLPSAVNNWNGDTTPDVTFTTTGLYNIADTGTNVGLGMYNPNGVMAWDDLFAGSLP